MDTVRDSVSEIDRKLQFRMTRLDTSVNEINRGLRDVRDSMIDEHIPSPRTTTSQR